MLVLSRKIGEEIIIADRIRVKVVGIQGNRVKIGIVAPEDVAIHRQEIYQIRREFAEPNAIGAEVVASN
jgi:carbon storage regulator